MKFPTVKLIVPTFKTDDWISNFYGILLHWVHLRQS